LSHRVTEKNPPEHRASLREAERAPRRRIAPFEILELSCQIEIGVRLDDDEMLAAAR
jgi:hypothetical protein